MKRQEIEQEIARKVIADALAAGYSHQSSDSGRLREALGLPMEST